MQATLKHPIWTPTLAWLAAAVGALVLALATPSESNVMGQLPEATARQIDRQRVVLPNGLRADRTLALVAYSREQRSEIESWVRGLRLDEDASIAWVKMPVLNDPGDDDARDAIQHRLQVRHPVATERARLVPVFTNREAFTRAAGLTGTGQASVLVLNREGRVLARAEGRFDEAKAQALRETLLAKDD